MSEKLKTFIIDEGGNFNINCYGKIHFAIKRGDETYNLASEQLIFTRNQLIKLFNLDLEVDDED